MSAELLALLDSAPLAGLRDTAALIRERAEAATPGPWRALCDGYGDTTNGQTEDDRRDLLWVRSGPRNDGDIVSTQGIWTERSADDVLFIASMHPGVGLALANVIDSAIQWHFGDCDGRCWRLAPLVTLARAYLGADA